MTTLISGHSHDFRKPIQTLIFYHLLFDCWLSDTASSIFSASNFLQSLQLLFASFFILRYFIDSVRLRVYQKMLANLVSWLTRLLNWNRLKCLEIINISNINRYLLSIYVESVLKVFKHVNSPEVWSLVVG